MRVSDGHRRRRGDRGRLGSSHRPGWWGSKRSGRSSGRQLRCHLLMYTFQVLCEDSDLLLHCQDYLFHLGVGLLSEDSLYPSSCSDYLLHGTASEFLDFCRQRATDSTEKSVSGMAFCCFLVARVQAFSEPLDFDRELHYFFGASFKFLRAAQASSLTEPTPRRDSSVSLATSHDALSSRLARMLDPVAPIRSWHQVILALSVFTSPNWNLCSSSANQSDNTCCR